MAATNFIHVALTCKDPIAVERFYTKHFGFTRARVVSLGEEQIVFIKSGGLYFEIFQAKEEAPVPPAGKDGATYPGLRHVAFAVENVDAKLEEMGDEAVVTLGPLDFDDFIPGWRTVWVQDPEGNIIEIAQGYVDQDDPPPLEME
jgi:glyoxylase I family protein